MTYEESEHQKTKEEILESFRSEIALKKQAEMAKKAESKGKHYDPHFDDIDPQHLEWNEYEAHRDLELMDPDTFRKLREERLAAFSDKLDEEEDKKHKSVKMFWAYLANMMDVYAYNQMQLEGALGTDNENDS